jgi:hypothetical protein
MTATLASGVISGLLRQQIIAFITRIKWSKGEWK